MRDSYMDLAVKALVEAIHASPTRAVLYVTGGASQALGWLLSVPGASQTLLEATVPYSRRSLVHILGQEPAKYASSDVARDLATAALARALTLSRPGVPLVGIGCTCALGSVPLKRGEHRCFVSARTQSHVWDYSLTFTKGKRDRAEEDAVASRLMLQVLADACGVRGSNVQLALDDAEQRQLAKSDADVALDEQLRMLLNGAIPMLAVPAGEGTAAGMQRQLAAIEGARMVVLPGSFNPLHEGHLSLMEAARRTVGGETIPCFEIAAINADKGALAIDDIQKRLEAFRHKDAMVVVTSSPFFSGKAELLPDSTFVVGIDTAVRLVNAKYYEGSLEKMETKLLEIGRQGCDFAVAGRIMDGKFQTLSDIRLPPAVAHLFKPVPEFRKDISSTEIRKARAATSSSM